MNKLTQRAHKNFIIFPSRTKLILPEKSVDNKFDVIGLSVYFIFHFHKLDFLRQLSFNGLISLFATFLFKFTASEIGARSLSNICKIPDGMPIYFPSLG